MSVMTGIAPSELVELDGLMWDALVQAIDEKWTPELELAAELVELESALVVSYLQAHSRKRLSLKPVQVARPEWTRASEEAEPVSPRVGVLALAELAGKPIEPVEVADGE